MSDDAPKHPPETPLWKRDPEEWERFKNERIENYCTMWEKDYGELVSAMQARLGMSRVEAMLYCMWGSMAQIRSSVEATHACYHQMLDSTRSFHEEAKKNLQAYASLMDKVERDIDDHDHGEDWRRE